VSLTSWKGFATEVKRRPLKLVEECCGDHVKVLCASRDEGAFGWHT
jgi:hypothetical protein